MTVKTALQDMASDLPGCSLARGTGYSDDLKVCLLPIPCGEFAESFNGIVYF